jgi:hypothetical protein
MRYMFFFLILVSFKSYAQQECTEIALKTGSLNQAYGIVVGDSIFLKYDEDAYTPERTVWISRQGKIRNINLNELEKRLICGITNHGDTTDYYFFEEERKSIFIKLLRHHAPSGWKTVSSEFVELPGKLLGSYIEDELVLICATPKDYTIRVIQLEGIKVVQEKKFPLSDDIVKNKRKQVAFIQEGFPVKPDQAASPIKIIKEKEEIFLVIDEPFYEYGPPQGGTYKTTVIRLNLRTDDTTISTFFEQSLGTFSSVVFGGNLYRVINHDKLRLEVFDLRDSKKIYSKEFSRDIKYPGEAYIRIGKNNTVLKRNIIEGIIRSYNNPFVIVDKGSDDKTLVLTIGNHVEEKSGVPLVGSFGLIPMILGTIAGIAVRELSEAPSINSYFYMSGSLHGGFEVTNQTNLLKQKVDDYEAGKLIEKIKFKYKGYLDSPNRIYALYQQARLPKIKVVTFEHK